MNSGPERPSTRNTTHAAHATLLRLNGVLAKDISRIHDTAHARSNSSTNEASHTCNPEAPRYGCTFLRGVLVVVHIEHRIQLRLLLAQLQTDVARLACTQANETGSGWQYEIDLQAINSCGGHSCVP